jgi:hypothetical protein
MAKATRTRRLWPDAKRGPWQIQFAWGVLKGRSECIGVEIRSAGEPLPLTTTLLRDIPLATLIDRDRASQSAKEQVTHLLAAEIRQKGKGFHFVSVPVHTPASRKGGRRPLYGPQHFQEVAKVYAETWQLGRKAPTTAVAERWHVTPSTAAKWVARARQMRLLGPTEQGHAGGLIPSVKPEKTPRTGKRRRKG